MEAARASHRDAFAIVPRLWAPQIHVSSAILDESGGMGYTGDGVAEAQRCTERRALRKEASKRQDLAADRQRFLNAKRRY